MFDTLTKGKKPVIISGPCSAESEEQVIATCMAIAKTGKVDMLRAGIWKPRTRPNTFEGVGAPGLKWLKEAGRRTNLPVAVEVANTKHVEEALKSEIDVLWVGARTTVNPFSVQEIADALRGTSIPVMIKNPLNADEDLWSGALERMIHVGLTDLALIHRGFAQYGKSVYRNEPKWQIPLEMKRRFPTVPMICDPSHITGKRENIAAISQQALDMDFDGLMIESHITPDQALSDAAQQVTPQALKEIIDSLIVRSSSVLDEALLDKLEALRKQMDIIDDDLVKLLGERMKVAEEIGLVKKEKGLTILQVKRWEEIIERVTKLGGFQGLSENFLHRYLSAIHQESIDHQNEVMNRTELEEE
ncbi:MAG: chorismate mutase [Ekhidna sp.]|uniref:chorismate mutase n=1 Tax=Ekhidna sp. TaxID=2608089 RepID=UPI0032EBE682